MLIDNIKQANLSETEALALMNELTSVFSESTIATFVNENISYDDALNVAMSDDAFSDSFVSRDALSASDVAEIAELVAAATDDIVYYLVNYHSDAASSIFKELKFYRSKGII